MRTGAVVTKGLGQILGLSWPYFYTILNCSKKQKKTTTKKHVNTVTVGVMNSRIGVHKSQNY